MPAPGDQHLNPSTTNPFEEVKPHISHYTAQEIAILQSRLEKQLGPEYISSRSGPSGQKVHYVAAEKCIQLANEIFGFNGWSSQIKEIQVDFVDEHPQTLKISLGLSVVVRVTLRDGTFHEDVGYGHIENCKGKAAAFEKAKKEGTTDGLKRALRSFGNVLGNCIYDKEYLSKVTKIKVQPGKWDVSRLHRHIDHTPIKKEVEIVKVLEEKPQNGAALAASITTEDTLDDEFGEFDESDFSVPDPEAHPDEVVLPELSVASHRFNGPRNGNRANTSGINPNQGRAGLNRQQPMRPPNGVQGNTLPPQPQTPNSGFTRSTSGAGPGMQMLPLQDSGPLARLNPVQPVVAGRVLNQPSRTSTGPPSAPVSPAKISKPSDESDTALPPPGAGFFSARAAAMVPEGSNVDPLPPSHAVNLPAFNPNLDSPSIWKTPGVDHKSSKHVTRDLKHIPASSQAVAAGDPGPRPNVVNPQLNSARRIGAPGSPSPMGNRGQYKAPTILKRPIDGVGGGAARVPLVDLPANGAIGNGDAEGDAKRQRLNN